jgi:hypothetical protein
MVNQAAAKNFELKVIQDFAGYVSSVDKTRIAENVLVQGSQNVYKKLSGTLSVRPGQKRRGVANTTLSPISSEFVWNTSWGATYPLMVSNSNLYVEYNLVWYSLLSGLTKTRYVFDKWYEFQEKKDRVLFVNGTDNIYHWSGGIATIASVTSNTLTKSGTTSWQQSGFATQTAGEKKIMIQGVEYTYTGGESTTALTGVTPNPIVSTTDQSQVIQDGSTAVGEQDVTTKHNKLAQSFIAGQTNITGVNLWKATDTGTFTGTVTVSLLSDVGGSPSNTLATVTISNADYLGISAGQKFTAEFGTAYTTAVVGTKYWIYIETSTSDTSNHPNLGTNTAGGYTSGSVKYYATADGWTDIATIDLYFKTLYSVVAGDIAIQSVQTETSLPMAGFRSDFIKVINNQAYIGSYSCRLCWISANDDFTDYTVPATRVAGDPEMLTLDGSLNGIGVRSGNAWIAYGSGEWANIIFSDITVGTDLLQQTKVDVVPVTKLGSAYAHEFITNSGDNIIYLAKDQQVRVLGDFNNLFTAGYPSLSQEINSELAAENFTGGGMKSFGDFLYLTAPASGKTYLYQQRQSVNDRGNVVAERLWHSPQIWNATRIDEISGVIYAFSNANPQIYQVWDTNQYYDDSPSDEQLPYTAVLAFGYRNGGRRQGIINFDKIFSEGYITKGTPLNLLINYDYQGANGQVTVPVNSIDRPAYTFGASISSLGDSSLGEHILGDEIKDVNNPNGDLVKYKVINSLGLQNCFEYQPIYYSDAVNSQWELLATGVNLVLDEQEATFIINKKR